MNLCKKKACINEGTYKLSKFLTLIDVNRCEKNNSLRKFNVFKEKDVRM